MKKETMILIAMLLFSMIFIAGCVGQQTAIKSPEDVGKSLENVSGGVEKVSGILTDVDKVLGGG